MEELYAESLPLAEIARKANVSYTTAYVYTKAKQGGFASRSEYMEHLAKQRQQQPINQKLSKLIRQRLNELGKSQKWLASQLGITEGAVSRYISGKTKPRKSLERRLFEVLELPTYTIAILKGS